MGQQLENLDFLVPPPQSIVFSIGAIEREKLTLFLYAVVHFLNVPFPKLLLVM